MTQSKQTGDHLALAKELDHPDQADAYKDAPRYQTEAQGTTEAKGSVLIHFGVLTLSARQAVRQGFLEGGRSI